ncbi:nitroreductase family protein [Clostridium baratii]|uniref:nitroreductase family protein n=1 Tax=Clostridium baratii TaxID=1561 RepID=UPI0028FDEB90|nr:nitroreductase family protein [Clostridium baratii]MDU1054411.1 nitroreductase family protein [Clostridium baratii]
MELLEVMSQRYSCRSFNDKKISRGDLELILKGGYLAPVGKGEYNKLLITVIENKELLNEIDKVGSRFFDGNIKHPTYSSNTVILISAKKNKNELIQYCNASCIIENMLLMATNLGIQSVYLLGAIEAVKQDSDLCKKLGLGEEYFPVAAVAIGYDVIKSIEINKIHKIETVYLK